MEQHKQLGPGIDKWKPSLNDSPVVYFEKSINFTREFYRDEYDRINSTSFDCVDSNFFFREYTWVVHATGFSAKAVGKFMGRLFDAYGNWDVMSQEKFDDVFLRVQPVCNNPMKAKAIWKTSKIVREGVDKDGWKKWRNDNLSTPELLSKLPYVGKITCYHLGRNIGLLDCVKPDLHLVRMAEHWGYKNCFDMCLDMQKKFEEKTGHKIPLGMIDLSLWYSASTFGTLEIKKEGNR